MTADIVADRLSKRYRITRVEDRSDRITEALTGQLRRLARSGRGAPQTDFWALRDVSFEVAHGSAVGVIGRNGAGKSTLLKILTRITAPTSGRAELRGRVASLLEVGTGFHSELTGRENVYMSGALLGMRRAEISRKFDEIVAFSGIEPFIDTPVKRYSSGMAVRLGFAVAAHLEADILLVDEVLAVGDAEFQRRCLNRMEGATREGRTVVFVSHNMAAVSGLCETAVLLDHGTVVATGAVTDVIDTYRRGIQAVRGGGLAERTDRTGTGALRFVGAEGDLRTGADSRLRLAYRADGELRNVEVSVAFYAQWGETVLGVGNALTGDSFVRLPAEGILECAIPRFALRPGSYSLNVYATVDGVLADWVKGAADVDVHDGDFFGTGRLPDPDSGHVLADHAWALLEPDAIATGSST